MQNIGLKHYNGLLIRLLRTTGLTCDVMILSMTQSLGHQCKFSLVQ